MDSLNCSQFFFFFNVDQVECSVRSAVILCWITALGDHDTVEHSYILSLIIIITYIAVVNLWS